MTRFVIGNVGVFPFSGSAAVTGNLQVSGAGNHPGAILEVMGPATGPGLRVTGNAEITGDLTVKGTTITVDSATNLKVEGELSSSGPLIVTGQGQVKGALLVSGASTFSNDVTITKDLHVTAGTTISGAFSVASSSMSQLNVSRGLTVTEDIVSKGTLKVSGAATLAGILSSSAPIQTSNQLRVGSTLHVSGATTIGGTTTVAGLISSSAPIQTSDELRVGENLFVSGTATIGSIASPTFAGDANFTNDVSISGSLFISSSVASGSSYPLLRIDHHNLTGSVPVLFVTGSGIVGIGTDNPRSDSSNTNALHILGGGAGSDNGQDPVVNTVLTLENNDHVGLQFLMPNQKAGQITWGTAGAARKATLYFDSNFNVYNFEGTGYGSTRTFQIHAGGDGVNIGESNAAHCNAHSKKANLHISSSTKGIDTGGAVLLRIDHAEAMHSGSLTNNTGTIMLVTGSGRVGILTETPQEALDVGDNSDVSARIGRAHVGYDGTTSDYAIFAHRDNVNTTDYAVQQRANGTTVINAKSGQSVSLRVANQNALVVAGASNSNIGINTGSPAARLHVVANTGEKEILRCDGEDLDNVLYVSGTGQVGIGTSSPAASLSIVGDLSASTNIQAAGQVRVGETLHVSGAINGSSLAAAVAANGLNIDFSGANTGTGLITIADNLAAALTVKEGSNEVIKIVSSNSSEEIVLGYNISLIEDGSAINFGANGEVILSHVHDEGLLLTHTATGDNTPVTLTLKSEEDAIIADEVIGAINFKGGDSDGTDTILVAAAIEAVATDTHEADRNATKLAFKTAISEAATEKMTLTSSGSLGIGVTDPDAKLEVLSTSTQAKFSYDADSFATVAVADDGHTTLASSTETVGGGNITLDAHGDIVLQADGGQVNFQRPGTTNRFIFDVSTSNVFLTNIQNSDMIFRVGTSQTEVFRIDQSEDSVLMTTDSKVQFRDTATHINSSGANVLDIVGPTIAMSASTAMTIDTDSLTISSTDTTNPLVVIKNTTNDANGSRLHFVKDKGAAGADGDDIGVIEFISDDAGQAQTSFAKIVAEVSEADNTDEAGKLSFFVAESDGTTTALTAGLILEGEHATDGEVDVTIAAGAASTTTVAGTLTVTSGIDANDANITNVGDIDADSVSVADAANGLNIDFSGANTGTGLITIADNLAAALTVKEGSNEIVKIVSTNSSEEIVLGYKLDLGDNDIENVGTISADVLQPDAAGTGLDIQFEGNTTKNKMTLTDNLADALNITEAGNSYLKFTTTNSSEAITAGVAVNGTIFSGSTSILSQKDLKAHDANIEAMLKVSGNVRLGLSSSTAVTVNTDTLDSYKAPQFYILSGTTTVKLPGNHPAGTWFVFKAGNAHFGPTEDIITLSATAGDTIDGNTTHVIQSPFASVNCVSDGANWFIW